MTLFERRRSVHFAAVENFSQTRQAKQLQALRYNQRIITIFAVLQFLQVIFVALARRFTFFFCLAALRMFSSLF